MSIKQMAIVWELRLRASVKLVALSLADQANDEGYCWPSIATLERRCGLSDRGVRNALNELEEGGLLERHQRPGRSTYFRVLTPAPRSPPTPAPGADHPGTTFTPPRHDVHPTPAPGAGHPGTTFTQNPKGTQKEPKEEPKSARGASPIGMPVGLNQAALELWEQWLRRKGKPTDDMQRPLIATHLVAFGDASRQLEVVNHSIRRGWVSLHAPRPDTGDAANAVPRVRAKTVSELELEAAAHA